MGWDLRSILLMAPRVTKGLGIGYHHDLFLQVLGGIINNRYFIYIIIVSWSFLSVHEF